MRSVGLLFVLALAACTGDPEDTSDTGDTADTSDTATDTSDTSDTGDTADSAEPTAADLLEDGETVQEVLDAGYTPLEIYEADNTLLNTIYGSRYQGGLIFHLDTTAGTGLIAQDGTGRDQTPWTGVPWCDLSFDLTGSTGLAVGTGAANTAAIVAACDQGGTTAASACADLVVEGYDDWFLPSRDELQLMYTNLKANGNQGALYANHYWSSSQVSETSAYYVFFATGAAAQDDKTDPDRVRAVRAF